MKANTEKEMVEEIKRILDGEEGESNEDIEIKLALYLYIKLAELKSCDERIYFGNREEIARCIRESRRDSMEISRAVRKRKLTCISLSHLYKKVLKNIGIECDVVQEDLRDVHLNNVITLKSGRKIPVDLQQDLYRIQAKMKPLFFGENEISEERLAQMLIEIGYVKSKEDFRNNKLRKVKKKVKDLSLDEALKGMLESKETYEGMEFVEASEAYKYYNALRIQILGNEKIHQFPCFLKDEKGRKIGYTFCIYADTGNYKKVMPYLYSRKRGKMLQTSLELLAELENEGLQLGKNKSSKKVRRLKKYMKELEKDREKNYIEEER